MLNTCDRIQLHGLLSVNVVDYVGLFAAPIENFLGCRSPDSHDATSPPLLPFLPTSNTVPF